MILCGSIALAQSSPAPQVGSIAGAIVDESSGLALANAKVEAQGPTAGTATTDSSGKFEIANLHPGLYHLQVRLNGYQTTVSDQLAVLANESATVTLSMQREAFGSQGLRVIGHTSVRASQSLQRASVVYKSTSVESIEREGYYRVSDFLQTLPQVNVSAATGGSDTPSPGDDQYLDIRGIGGLETVALLDGHPIGFGINRGKNLGYNWEISPTFALRNVDVVYGSGAEGLTPYSAVGGVIDMQTLNPTPEMHAQFKQGWGTFDKAVTSFNATGPITSRLGFAVAAGVQSIDGPYKNSYFYQPAAAFDASAPVGSSVYNLGIYKDDTAVVNRGDMLKFRWGLGNPQNLSHLTVSALSAYYWDDKTGNGDQDYLPYDTALAIGNNALAGYTPPVYATPPPSYGPSAPPPCGKGTFLGTNANGSPWGFGPNGQPDGGHSCVTPQQYAGYENGLQGAGAAYQAFHIADYSLKYEQPTGNGLLTVDGFTNRWFQLYDRTFQMPFFAAPGDNLFTLSPSVSTSGASIADMFAGEKNDIGLGFGYNNYAYQFYQNGAAQPSPTVHDVNVYMQDVYHPSSRYSVYVNAAEKNSSITNTSALDPRVALIYNVNKNDVVRVAAGTTWVQPYATYIDLPYSPIASGALNGNLNCTGLTTIGQVANPSIRPERAVDQEVSFGHRFGTDSQIQATVYSENVSDKIYSEVIPVAGLPAGTIPAATLANFQAAANSGCGGTAALGVNSQNNVGRLLAQGIDINGRARATRNLFFDYDYSVESSALKAADAQVLQNNLTLILGSQLPGVPLHKAQLAADYAFDNGIDVRLTQYYVDTNNAKNSPAYNYGDLTIGVPVRHDGEFNIAIGNLFNQYQQYNGLIGHGVPLPLNQYATAANYAPVIGASATELYGLPPRQIFFTYTAKLK